MAPAQAVFIGRNEFVRRGQLWGPSRRLERPLDAVPTGQLVCSKRAAARANEPIVDALLQVLALAGWRMRRWLTMRACCCAARDALPAFFTDESLQDFSDARPLSSSAGPSWRPVCPPNALRCVPQRGQGKGSSSGAYAGGAISENFLIGSRAAIQSGAG